jgi:hypothetical protein
MCTLQLRAPADGKHAQQPIQIVVVGLLNTHVDWNTTHQLLEGVGKHKVAACFGDVGQLTEVVSKEPEGSL